MLKKIRNTSIIFGITMFFFGTSLFSCVSENIQLNDFNNEYEQQLTEKITEDFTLLPLFFTQNQGQFPKGVLFQAHCSGISINFYRNKLVTDFFTAFEKQSITTQVGFLDSQEISLHHCSQNVKETISVASIFVGANQNGIVTGDEKLPHYNHYFIGKNPENWYTNVPNFKTLWYHNIYPNIDLKFYSVERALKYDFIVHPGGNIKNIIIKYENINTLAITPSGDLEIRTKFGCFYEQAPYIYQQINGILRTIKGHYRLLNQNTFGFTIEGTYDESFPIIIDPKLDYSTYLGDTYDDKGLSIAVDTNNNAYITGFTNSLNFPTTDGAYDNTPNGGGDVFIAKLSASIGGVSSLLYSTYLGGSYFDSGEGIAVDNIGNAYITGYTVSPDFPMNNSFDNSPNGNDDVFVAKISSLGSTLLYSTYLGGSNQDNGASIAVDEESNVYVTGYTESSLFPTLNSYDDSYNGGGDVFIAKLSPSVGGVNSLIYSTYLGGTGYETGECIVVDDEHNGYIVGFTESPNFPTLNPYDNSLNGSDDVCVVKLSSAGNTLLYSTYLGGSAVDIGSGIAIDSDNKVYITGYTESIDFPTVNPYDDSYNLGGDAFIAQLSPSTGGVNSLLYSTYLGHTNYDSGESIAVDHNHCAYVTGFTESEYFPMVFPCNGTYQGNGDVFIAKISPNLSGVSTLAYSTFLGGNDADVSEGIALDNSTNIYIIGYTISNDFPRMHPYDGSYNGGFDVFLSYILGNLPPNTPTAPGGVNYGYTNRTYTYTSVTTDPEGNDLYYLFNWDDGTNSGWLGPYHSGQEATTSHSWESPRVYRIRVIAKDSYNALSNCSDPLNILIDPSVILKITKYPKTYDIFSYPFYYYVGKIEASITNVGIENSGEVRWDIVLYYKNNFTFLGDNSGSITDIAPNETVSIFSGNILGIGKTNITIRALTMKTGIATTTYDEGFTIFSYVLLKKSIVSQKRW